MAEREEEWLSPIGFGESIGFGEGLSGDGREDYLSEEYDGI